MAKSLLHDIMESVRYVKASQTRIQAFATCVERVGIRSGAGLFLDVPTRWNSTYEMLVRALKFREAFKSLEAFDRNYRSLPSDAEWDRGQKYLNPEYPTSSGYFTQVWMIELLLK